MTDDSQWSSVKQEASSKAHAIMLWVSLGKFSRTAKSRCGNC
ncbi:MAG: hypothetical protein QNJ74_09270 [Trichodesmium sp. MO_231.B1]|nr:hypothetical protein [Trichodesmium sp. MO_231.B1]